MSGIDHLNIGPHDEIPASRYIKDMFDQQEGMIDPDVVLSYRAFAKI